MALNLNKLSEREEQVYRVAANLLSNAQIAAKFAFTVHTAKMHKQNIYSKLGLNGTNAIPKHAKMYPEFLKIETPISNELFGFWLSHFRSFGYVANSASYQEDQQIGLQYVQPSQGFFNHRGENIHACRKSKRDPYLHTFKFCVERQSVRGFWENKSPVHSGCFQLQVFSSMLAMEGIHLGNASNGIVKSGSWMWLKVRGDFDPIELKKRRLRPYSELINTFNGLLDARISPDVSDLFT